MTATERKEIVMRVEGLSGTLAVESEPGSGTAICARLPLPAGGA
jgi:signal transduction histidine kinase